MGLGVRKGTNKASSRLVNERNQIKTIKQPTLVQKWKMALYAWHFKTKLNKKSSNFDSVLNWQKPFARITLDIIRCLFCLFFLINDMKIWTEKTRKTIFYGNSSNKLQSSETMIVQVKFHQLVLLFHQYFQYFGFIIKKRTFNRAPFYMNSANVQFSSTLIVNGLISNRISSIIFDLRLL